MSKSIHERLGDAFVSDDGNVVEKNDVLEYMNMLRANLDAVAHAMRRSVTLSLTASALFVLLWVDASRKLSLGPIEFLKNSNISIFLTSISAFYFLDMTNKSEQFFRAPNTLMILF